MDEKEEFKETTRQRRINVNKILIKDLQVSNLSGSSSGSWSFLCVRKYHTGKLDFLSHEHIY
jgi:hypothetical protein